LKLETLQPINSFKLRGALNALAVASEEDVARGVLTASAGNMAQGVAYGARALGVPCSVVVPEHAPTTKLEVARRLGAEIISVPFDTWWTVLETGRYDGVEGLFVHPVRDAAVMAGNGTIGLEILEDCSDVDTVIVPCGGGGLATGIGSAVKQLKGDTQVISVEPATAAPVAASFARGEITAIDYQPSFVDGAGGRGVLPEMWPLLREVLDHADSVSLEQVGRAIRLLAERVRLIAEGAGALSVASAVFARQWQEGQSVVCVVSGGNIDISTLCGLLSEEVA